MPEQNKENNLKASGETTLKKPSTELSDESSAELTEQDTPFYNVMPKEEQKGPLVGPKLEIKQDTIPEAHEVNLVMRFIEAHKMLVIILLAILILAYPVYFVLNKYVIKSAGEENLLSDEALGLLQGGSQQPQNQKEKANTKTPAEWQSKYFGNEQCQDLEECGDEADLDRDGLKNFSEFEKQTDPNNNDCDQDGLSDGDEVYVFESDPLNSSTVQDPNYNDGEYVKGAYDPKTKDKKYSPSEILDVSAKMKQFGLHAPTLDTLGNALFDIYKFTSDGTQQPPPAVPTSTTTTETQVDLKDVDSSPEAKQDRDTQRSNTIKNIGIALVKYQADKQAFPKASDFSAMFSEIKIYTKVATNPQDPINKGQYVYTYTASQDGKDFNLTFFSETQNQIIRINSQTAKKYQQEEEAAIYDDQRKNNLETIRTALLLYSANNEDGTQEYVFPKKEDYQTALVPEFITEIPKDPKTNEAYEYQVAETFDSFTLKVVLGAPPTGRTGYLCNQEECRYY